MALSKIAAGVLVLFLTVLARADIVDSLIVQENLTVQGEIIFSDGTRQDSAAGGQGGGVTVSGEWYGGVPVSVPNAKRIIFDVGSGFYITESAIGEVLVTLGSHWHTLYLDDGKTYAPSGEQNLQIKVNTNSSIRGTMMDTNTTPWTLYIPDSTSSSAARGYDTNTLFSQDINVVGVTVGGYTDGMKISADEDLRSVITKMLQKVIPYSYLGPMLAISISPAQGNYEVGTFVEPLVTTTWTQRDAGALTNFMVSRSSVFVFTNGSAVAYQSPSIQIGNSAISFFSRTWYAQGTVGFDNFGQSSPHPSAAPNPSGGYPEGVISSSTLAYNGRRRAWFEADASASQPSSSAQIRSLSSSIMGPSSGTSFTITIPSGSRRVVFAYPHGLGAVSSVKYIELGSAEVKDTFLESVFDVEGNNGFEAIPYRVYIYVPIVPFGDVARYAVTI